MNPEEIINKLSKTFPTKSITHLKHSLTSMFQALINEVNEAIEECGYNSDDFVVSVYPFSLERLDKKPVDKSILHSIKRRLST
jgi:KaiC/GvpD/RAD55 family RecA-like ATPase